MTKFALAFSLLCTFALTAFAGESYSSNKEVVQQAPPPCQWYRAHEWDLNLWGTYAFPENTGRSSEPFSGFLGFFHGINSSSHDRFIDRDNAWGGGADIKYFFSKYWALGAEGFVLDTNTNIGGAGLGTFTLRYPIGCSRFAPYAWVGGGVTAGGGHYDEHKGAFNILGLTQGPIDDIQHFGNKRAEATAQFGAGLEVRITPRIGVMADFAWNVMSGPNNNFGMVRSGLTLSY
jgi:hypothetical protein